jgi:multicomponent Na+:H+ antiporter subunit G
MTMPTIQAAVVAALVLVGSAFLLVGTIGLLRLPNVYNRLHATSKATTLGASSIFLAGFVYFGGNGAGLEALVGIAFLFLTAPTGAHMISRAARKMGVTFRPDVYWPREDDLGWINAENVEDDAGLVERDFASRTPAPDEDEDEDVEDVADGEAGTDADDDSTDGDVDVDEE